MLAALVGVASVVFLVQPVPSEPLRWQEDPAYGLVVVVGRPNQEPAIKYQQALSLHVGDCDQVATTPAILARIETGTDEVQMVPQFPLDPQGNYCAILRSRHEEPSAEAVHAEVLTMPWNGERTAQYLRVIRVMPSVSVLPANALRLYLEFSRPVFAKDVHTWIRLRDNTVEKWVDTPFVEIPQGLWDGEQRRLTLIFHPGRIKREVGPNRALGPPLASGHDYTLVVEAPSGARFEHHFQATDADRAEVNPATWSTTSLGDQSLRVDFGEALDPYLVERSVRVEKELGEPVEAQVEVAPSGEYLLLGQLPEAGQVRLRVHHRIEDLAGNRIGSLFDRELSPDRNQGFESEPGSSDQATASGRESAWITVPLAPSE